MKPTKWHTREERRAILRRLQKQMGPRMFSEFIVDLLTDGNKLFVFSDLPILVSAWYAKRDYETAEAKRKLLELGRRLTLIRSKAA